VVGTLGNGQVSLTWSAPTDNGGNTISDYTVQYCINDSCSTFVRTASAATSATVTGLSNGTAYTFQVAAVNAAGQGSYSVRSSAVTPRTVPDAPTTVLSVVDNTGGVDVSWTAPTNTGGNAISDYTVQSCISSTCSTFTRTASTDTSVKVTGLVKGTAYTFQVAAKNAAGTGAYSLKSSPAVTPRAVPGVPSGISGVLGNGQVALTWTAPATNGDAISDYTIQSCLSTTCTTFVHDASANTGITVTGLTNGSAYTFKVAAKNAAGTGEAGVSTSYIPRRAPDAPTTVLSVVDNTGGVDVSWTAPTNTGGNAISDYTL
jgi:hypothetical protein